MAHNKIYLNDLGHIFTISTEKDLTNVNSATLEVLKPDNTSVSLVASISNVNSGLLVYVTQSGDMSLQGIYEAQAKIWSNSDNEFKGDTFNFEVFSRYT